MSAFLPVLFALLFSSTGCNLFPRVCTSAGCDSGLTVWVRGGTPSTPMTVKVTAPNGTSQTQMTTCTTNSACPSTFADFVPSRVTVQVTQETRSASATFDVSYTTSRPNGQSCPPECRTSSVEITIPSPAPPVSQR